MKRQRQREGKVLIAEFLGSQFINDAPEDYQNGYYYQPEGIENDCPTGVPEDWCFESSWDWLMPVVEKIGKTFTVRIIRCPDSLSNECEIETIDSEPVRITYTHGNDFIGVVFDAVVNFIKWYNARCTINTITKMSSLIYPKDYTISLRGKCCKNDKNITIIAECDGGKFGCDETLAINTINIDKLLKFLEENDIETEEEKND